jgi:hypothetical protein
MWVKLVQRCWRCLKIRYRTGNYYTQKNKTLLVVL